MVQLTTAEQKSGSSEDKEKLLHEQITIFFFDQIAVLLLVEPTHSFQDDFVDGPLGGKYREEGLGLEEADGGEGFNFSNLFFTQVISIDHFLQFEQLLIVDLGVRLVQASRLLSVLERPLEAKGVGRVLDHLELICLVDEAAVGELIRGLE